MSHAPPPSEFFSRVLRRYRIPGLSLTILRQEGHRELPCHGHRNAYISFLIGGSYRERAGSRELVQCAPSVVYHPPDLEHTDAYGPGGGRFLAIEMERSWLDACNGPALDRSGPQEVGGDEVLRDAWAVYVELLSSDAPLPLSVETRVADLVSALLPAATTSESRRPDWLRRVVDRLAVEYVAPPSMSVLARDSGVHPAHLSRTFRRFLGCSPTAFVHRQRVRHVWERLTRDGTLSLADVALEAGFSDQSHCSRVFRRFVGSPPGALRREIGPGPTARR